MKKHLLFGIGTLAIACVAFFASCDPESLTTVMEEGLYGSANVTITDNNGSQNIGYQSSIIDHFVKEDPVSGQTYVAAIDFSANIDLSKGELTFPFMAYQITDTIVASYPCDQLLTEQRLHNFNFDSIAALISNPSGFNMMVIAVSDTSWYVSNSGSINITSFPTVGNVVQGNFNNIGAYYFTMSDVERLNDALENGADFNLNQFFHPVTITGTFTSRRTTVIHDLVEEAFYNGGLTNL